ncbi:MAG: hypothetical protein ACJ8AT_38120, partial [Hyalangium sp.]|uniref:hypothetical protein n=1 Tax=Hyalangium sp. TaxID=2028555 RepID=UPI00389B10AB
MSTAPSETTVQPTRIYRLRPSVHFAPLEQGVFFKSWSRSFSFKGHASLYPLFERLLPHLEKGVRAGDLLAAVPENVRRVISTLLEQLAGHDMLLDVEALSQPPPSALEAEQLGSTLSYLESVAADPHAAFSRLRRARVLVGGGGPALFACVRALAGIGVGHLACAVGEPEPVASQLKLHPLTAHELLPSEQLVDRARGAWDMVLSLPQSVELESVARLEEETTAPLLQVALGESLGVLGPLGHREGCGLWATLARLRVSLGEARKASPVMSAFLGNLAAFEAFKQLVGVPSATQQRQCAVVRQESLVSRFHPVEPVSAPAELEAAALRRALESFQQLREPLDRKALV